MRPLVRSALPPSQRSAQPTFGQGRTMARAERIKQLSTQQRKLTAAQFGADQSLQKTLRARSGLVERQIGRLQQGD